MDEATNLGNEKGGNYFLPTKTVPQFTKHVEIIEHEFPLVIYSELPRPPHESAIVLKIVAHEDYSSDDLSGNISMNRDETSLSTLHNSSSGTANILGELEHMGPQNM